MRKIIVALVTLSILSLLLVGCSSGSAGGVPPGGSPVVALEPVLLDSHLSLSGYGGKRVYGDYWAAQTFVPSGDWDIQSVRLRVWVEGLIGGFKVSIAEVNNGQFSTTLDSQMVSPAELVIGDPGSWIEVYLSPTLIAGREYALLVTMDGGTENDTIRWVYDTGGSGGAYYSNNGGVEWYQVVDRDFAFEVWGAR